MHDDGKRTGNRKDLEVRLVGLEAEFLRADSLESVHILGNTAEHSRDILIETNGIRGVIQVKFTASGKLVNRRARAKIKLAPGTVPLRLVSYVFPPKTVERVFQPIIADLQAEYLKALSGHRTRFAAWLRFRYGVWLVTAAFNLVWDAIGNRLFGMWTAK